MDTDEFVDHDCSCHVRNAGACDICKILRCEVWRHKSKREE